MEPAILQAAALALAIPFALLAESGVPQSPQRVATLGIFVEFKTEPSSLAVEAMQAETASILAPAGLHLEWRALSENDGTESFNEIAVMEFHGECDGEAYGTFSDRDAPLGLTEVTEGRVLPFGKIECNQVRQTLRMALAASAQSERQAVLGRALGRVLAHELYHILARTTKHSAGGIAKPFYTAAELTSRALTLRPREIDSIRRCVHPHPGAHASLAETPTGSVSVTGKSHAFQK